MTLLEAWPAAGRRPRVIKLTTRSWAAILPAGPLLIHPTHTLALSAALAWARTKEARP